MPKHRRLLCHAALLLVLAGRTAGAAEPPGPAFDPDEVNPGGAATGAVVSTDRAYSQFAPNLSFIERGHFGRGDHLFRETQDGLGPLYNASTCQGCHVHDGRGNVPTSPAEPMISSFLRLSIPGRGEHGGVVPEPTYGEQLQTFAVEGLQPEGWSYVEYQERPGRFPDGEDYSLRQPVYKVRDLGYGPFHPEVMFSPRVAPPVFGLGLIEAIPETAILAQADPEDRDGDGISGRPNRVWDVLAQRPALGRFGLKAGNPSILQQLAGAFRGDSGITNPLFSGEVCSERQEQCRQHAQAEHTAHPNASALTLALVEFYNRTLAVPRRRDADAPAVLAGKRLFFEIGCTGCHTPRYQTGELPGSRLGAIQGLQLDGAAPPVKAVSNQIIWPYTDLLLHDMGGSCQAVRREDADGRDCAGDAAQCIWVQYCEGLADGRPEGEADGREWKTPPLWGIGLVKRVNPRAGYLHDGRGRDLNEAILWHGGEAEAAKERYRQLPRESRQALLGFLESL